MRDFLSNHGYFRIEDLQSGGQCGLCGYWCKNTIVEKDWPYAICDRCAGKFKFSISKQFTDTPGCRFISDGPFSGQEFRECHLEPLFLKAKLKNGTLLIDFDGCFGYTSSFLEEAFGGLARKYGSDKVAEILIFKSDDEIGLPERVYEYIHNCYNNNRIERNSK